MKTHILSLKFLFWSTLCMCQGCLLTFKEPYKTYTIEKCRYCSRRLTRVVFVRGLSSRARAPLFCSVCEYLKRSGQRGALAAVCTLMIKSASEKHQSDTPPYRNTVNGCSEGGQKNWVTSAFFPDCLCVQWVMEEGPSSPHDEKPSLQD